MSVWENSRDLLFTFPRASYLPIQIHQNFYMSIKNADHHPKNVQKNVTNEHSYMCGQLELSSYFSTQKRHSYSTKCIDTCERESITMYCSKIWTLIVLFFSISIEAWTRCSEIGTNMTQMPKYRSGWAVIFGHKKWYDMSMAKACIYKFLVSPIQYV